jgi:hypothetical protein
MKLFLICLMLACSVSACKSSSGGHTALRPLGSDRDAQGCIASAGYTWSPLRGACIRLFETGLSFLPDPAPSQGAVMATYVVLPQGPAHGVTVAECHLPGRSAPLPLTVVHTPEGDVRPTLLVNRDEGVQVFRHKDMHILDHQGRRFIRHSAPEDPLFLIR